MGIPSTTKSLIRRIGDLWNSSRHFQYLLTQFERCRFRRRCIRAECHLFQTISEDHHHRIDKKHWETEDRHSKDWNSDR